MDQVRNLMRWQDLDMKALKLAMRECTRTGLEATREKYGFRKARSVHMFHGDAGPFEARVLIAVAHGKKYPDARPLSPKDFKDCDAQQFLADFGFVKRQVGTRRDSVALVAAAQA